MVEPQPISREQTEALNALLLQFECGEYLYSEMVARICGVFERTPAKIQAAPPAPKAKPSAPTAPPVPPAREAYPGFKKVEDAQRWAAQKHPSVTWDFVGAHPDALNPTLSGIDRMLDEWPDVGRKITYVGTYVGHPQRGFLFMPGDIAHASVDGSTIGLNPAFFGDPKRFKKAMRDAKKSKWLGSDASEHIATHEFGHMVDAWLSTEHARSLLPFGTVGNKANVDLVARELRAIARTAPVSKYALTNDAEAFAELFASKPHDPSTKEGWLLSLARGATHAPPDYHALPTGPERDAAVKAIAAFVDKWNGFGLSPLRLSDLLLPGDVARARRAP
jgi:hypothetical protein